MSLATCFVIFTLYHLVFLINSAEPKCPQSFACGKHGRLTFPFSTTDNPDCGLFTIEGCNNSSRNPKIKLGADDDWYTVLHNISSNNRLYLRNDVLQNFITQNSCFAFTNMSLPKSPSVSFHFSPNLTWFTCFNRYYREKPIEFEGYNEYNCSEFTLYYSSLPDDSWESAVPEHCFMFQLPSNPPNLLPGGYVFDMLSGEFTLEWNVSDECYKCHHGGGQCLTNNMNSFKCKKGNGQLVLILAIAISGGAIFLIVSLAIISYIIWQRKKKLRKGGYLCSRDSSSHPSSKLDDVEDSNFFFGIPIFSYSDLEKATNHFDPSNELGDGGFGTVYYGKLKDGREVAIKRMYEHNYKRMEQFLNEIKILTCLRHPNLVSLYGCTSRRSRELLLVYEYVHNGTVADHLHGDRAKELHLTWDLRMHIAIETATALAYLHKSDIVHRDVKTNNILLDSNFRVKVADFGLSRFFPNDVSHVSTAPQGTPGYVDPEYHQCYQLTGKSDVYSFGVVLIELISSMPAVDITRHRHEINLANLAINRIQRCAFDELIDFSLGYEKDDDVKRMTTSVAELAFRCLQVEKDLRPTMDEVLEFLQSIERGEGFEIEKMANDGDENRSKVLTSPETDDAVLLKRKRDFIMSSPIAVTDAWVSSSSTTTSSMG